MKLKYLLTLPIIGTALVGCDDIEYSDAKPAENPQLPLIEAANFTVTPSENLTNGLNLDALLAKAEAAGGVFEDTDDNNNSEASPSSRAAEDTFQVELYTVNYGGEIPEGTALQGGFQISQTADFAEFEDISDVTITEGVASVPLAQLLQARTDMFGKDPGEYTIYYRIPLYVNYGGGQYRIGDDDFYYCDADNFAEEGVNPGYTVENTYYLIGPNGETIDDLIEFTHSEWSTIWDDPVFSVRFTAADDFSWKVVPESAYLSAGTSGSLDASSLYGVTANSDTTGVLVLGGDGLATVAGKYMITINLADLTYEIETIIVPDWLGTPNGSQNWEASTSQKLGLYNDADFLGFSWFGTEGKITTDQEVWCGVDNPLEGEDGKYSGVLNVGGGNNLVVEELGLYYISVNWNTFAINLTQIYSFGIVGSNNGWNADEPIALEAGEDYLTWTGTVTFDDDAEFKFVANTGWGIELAGSTDALVCTGGANINMEAGTYDVVLDLTSLPYKATFTAK